MSPRTLGLVLLFMLAAPGCSGDGGETTGPGLDVSGTYRVILNPEGYQALARRHRAAIALVAESPRPA